MGIIIWLVRFIFEWLLFIILLIIWIVFAIITWDFSIIEPCGTVEEMVGVKNFKAMNFK